MKKIIVSVFLIFVLVNLLFTGLSFAEEKVGVVKKSWRSFLGVFKKDKKEEPALKEEKIVKPELPKEVKEAQEKMKARPSFEDMTNDEIIDRIKYSLEAMPEIMNFIPDLSITKKEDGEVESIQYKQDGVSKDLKDLDKDTLRKLYGRVNSERVRIQTERIQRQLDAIRASQNIPKPPTTYTPPTPPRIPTLPPSPPKVPNIPKPPPNTSRR